MFVKFYEFLYSAKNKGENIGKNRSKKVSGKYSQKRLHHAKQSETDALRTASKRANLRKAVATGDLIGNEIANWITKASKTSQ